MATGALCRVVLGVAFVPRLLIDSTGVVALLGREC